MSIKVKGLTEEEKAEVLKKVAELLDIPKVEVHMEAGSREKVALEPNEWEYDGSVTLTIRVPPDSIEIQRPPSEMEELRQLNRDIAWGLGEYVPPEDE